MHTRKHTGTCPPTITCTHRQALPFILILLLSVPVHVHVSVIACGVSHQVLQPPHHLPTLTGPQRWCKGVLLGPWATCFHALHPCLPLSPIFGNSLDLIPCLCLSSGGLLAGWEVGFLRFSAWLLYQGRDQIFLGLATTCFSGNLEKYPNSRYVPIIVTWQRPLGVVEKPAALSLGWRLCPAVLAAKEDGCREPVSHRRTQKAVWSGERGVAMLNIQSWRAGSYSEKVW